VRLAGRHSQARRRQYSARRRTLDYGSIYDFTHLESKAAPPIPPFLDPLREKLGALAGVSAAQRAAGTVRSHRR
jgi:hypothetical protein